MQYQFTTGSIAFVIQRVSGLVLAVYLLVHLMSQGSITFPGKPLLLFLFLFHSFNGLRIILIDSGWGVERQKPLFWGFSFVGLILLIYLLL